VAPALWIFLVDRQPHRTRHLEPIVTPSPFTAAEPVATVRPIPVVPVQARRESPPIAA